MLLQLPMNAVPVRLRTLPRRFGVGTGWFPNNLASSSSSLQPSGTATDGWPQPPVPNVVDRAQPHPATTRDLPLPQPQLNLNRRTSFVFRMDILLAGTLFSLFREFLCR